MRKSGFSHSYGILDAVFGKNMEAFSESNDEDESCDTSSNTGDDALVAAIDSGDTEEDDIYFR
jgi:hypothetical protein